MPPDHADHPEEGELFHEGLELFNSGEWFEAHEVWEDAWNMSEGPRKRFYQGLIQCAVAMEHIRRGNPRGVRSVWQTAQTKFVGLPEVYMGVNIPRLLNDMKRVVQPILDLPAARFDPALPRGQELPFDANHPPQIDLECDPFAIE